jgi:hypothetical protein
MANVKAPDSYDPYELIAVVVDHLTTQGRQAAIHPGARGEALAGAGTLLRALGVAPMIDSVTALERSRDRVRSDEP